MDATRLFISFVNHGESIDLRSCFVNSPMSHTHFSSGSRNQVSECGPWVIEIGSGRMGALSDYICKSNEVVDKMVEIYIHVYSLRMYVRTYTYTHKIMDQSSVRKG